MKPKAIISGSNVKLLNLQEQSGYAQSQQWWILWWLLYGTGWFSARVSQEDISNVSKSQGGSSDAESEGEMSQLLWNNVSSIYFY